MSAPRRDLATMTTGEILEELTDLLDRLRRALAGSPSDVTPGSAMGPRGRLRA